MLNLSANGSSSGQGLPYLSARAARPGGNDCRGRSPRAQLADAVQRATRLLVALKHQRRHCRVLRPAIHLLRELRLGP